MMCFFDFTGAQLNITYGVGFNFNTLKEGLQRNFLDGKVYIVKIFGLQSLTHSDSFLFLAYVLN